MSKVKSAKSAKSTKPAKGAKVKAKAKKSGMKLIKITPAPNKTILERGGEFLTLRAKGFKQSQIIAMFEAAGVEVSTPAYYNAVKIAKAPKEVQAAISSGKVAPTLVLPFLKKKLNDKQVVERLNQLVAQRERHAQFLKKSGFGDGKASKLTMGRVVAVIRQKLEKLKKTNALTSARGQAALALTMALDNVRDAESIDALVAEFAGKK